MASGTRRARGIVAAEGPGWGGGGRHEPSRFYYAARRVVTCCPWKMVRFGCHRIAGGTGGRFWPMLARIMDEAFRIYRVV